MAAREADRSDFERLIGDFRVGDLDFVRHNETDFEALASECRRFCEAHAQGEAEGPLPPGLTHRA